MITHHTLKYRNRKCQNCVYWIEKLITLDKIWLWRVFLKPIPCCIIDEQKIGGNGEYAGTIEAFGKWNELNCNIFHLINFIVHVSLSLYCGWIIGYLKNFPNRLNSILLNVAKHVPTSKQKFGEKQSNKN